VLGAGYTAVDEVKGLVQKRRLGQSIWPPKPKISPRELSSRLDCMKQNASGVWGL
jgi:hypothetical protein